MDIDIKLHKEDLPDQIYFEDKIAIDCEFMGLNVERDRLCLVQISSGNKDAHIIQLNKDKYDAPNLKKLLIDKREQLEKIANKLLEKEILFQNDLETLIGKRPFESKQITQEEDKDEINKITDDNSSDKEEK